MGNTLSILSLILGSISIIGFLYTIIYWKAQVDADRKVLAKYPLAELATMTKTLWDIYILDALHNRPDLMTRHSPFQIQPAGEALIPANIKQMLASQRPCQNDFETAAWLVVKCVGIDNVRQLSRSISLSMTDTVGLLTAYYEKSHNDCSPLPPDCTPKSRKIP